MIVTRKSPFSGKVRSMDLPITDQQIADYMAGGKLIQEVFPDLTDSQREFILTGISDDEWNAEFADEDNPGYA